jgi:hypothetical protein
MANKIPTVHRCPINGGLTGESAYKWARFVADEYLFDPDNHLLYDTYTVMAEGLRPVKGKPTAASFNSAMLEKEIAKWTRSTD